MRDRERGEPMSGPPRRFSGERGVPGSHYGGQMAPMTGPGGPPPAHHQGYPGNGPQSMDMDRRRFSSSGSAQEGYSRPTQGQAPPSRPTGDRGYDHYGERMPSMKQQERPSPHLHSQSPSNPPIGATHANSDPFKHNAPGQPQGSAQGPPNQSGLSSFPIKSSYPPPSFMNKQLSQRRIDEDYDNDARSGGNANAQKMK
jgi:hypothetical protein